MSLPPALHNPAWAAALLYVHLGRDLDEDNQRACLLHSQSGMGRAPLLFPSPSLGKRRSLICSRLVQCIGIDRNSRGVACASAPFACLCMSSYGPPQKESALTGLGRPLQQRSPYDYTFPRCFGKHGLLQSGIMPSDVSSRGRYVTGCFGKHATIDK